MHYRVAHSRAFVGAPTFPAYQERRDGLFSLLYGMDSCQHSRCMLYLAKRIVPVVSATQRGLSMPLVFALLPAVCNCYLPSTNQQRGTRPAEKG